MAVGVLAAVRRNSALDYAATIGTLIGVSVPNFLLATLLVLVFSLWLRWLPPIGYVELTKDPIGNLRTHDPAGAQPQPAAGGRPHAQHPLRGARGAGPGARPGGASQRAHRAAGPRPPCDPECLIADPHRRRHPGRQPARGDGHHRDHLRAAGHRPLHLRGDRQPRLPGRAGRHHRHRRRSSSSSA